MSNQADCIRLLSSQANPITMLRDKMGLGYNKDVYSEECCIAMF